MESPKEEAPGDNYDQVEHGGLGLGSVLESMWQ